jgi:NADH dehydrogenase/NADH:ubiquinone oxidoreductase subunit G
MASIEDVWGTPFPKKYHTMASKYSQKEEPRDAEKEGRVHPTPIHRTNAAIQKHRKTIDDLSNSLPIANSSEEIESNFHPAKVPQTENFSMQYKTPYAPQSDYPYAPPSFQESAHELKLNRIMRMIEQNQVGYETPSSQDMMLYIFTGVFFLFTFDSFVNLGRRLN